MYGFWMVKFFRSSRGGVEAWDLVPDTSDDFQPRADLALDFSLQQVKMTERLQAELDPPSAFKLFAADPGVLRDRPVVSMFAIRRRARTTRDGSSTATRSPVDLDELRNEHLFHLVARGPRVVRHLALPPGWHVDLPEEGQARFEQPTQARSDGSAK